MSVNRWPRHVKRRSAISFTVISGDLTSALISFISCGDSFGFLPPIRPFFLAAAIVLIAFVVSGYLKVEKMAMRE